MVSMAKIMQTLLAQEGGHKGNGRQSLATSWASYEGQESSSEGCSSSDEDDKPEKRKKRKHDRPSENQTDYHRDNVDELIGKSKAESEPRAKVASLCPESDDKNLEILMAIDKEVNQKEKLDKPVSDTKEASSIRGGKLKCPQKNYRRF